MIKGLTCLLSDEQEWVISQVLDESQNDVLLYKQSVQTQDNNANVILARLIFVWDFYDLS